MDQSFTLVSVVLQLPQILIFNVNSLKKLNTTYLIHFTGTKPYQFLLIKLHIYCHKVRFPETYPQLFHNTNKIDIWLMARNMQDSHYRNLKR